MTAKITPSSRRKNSYSSSTNVRKAESPDERSPKNSDELFLQDRGQARVVRGLKADSDSDDRPRVHSFRMKSPIDRTDVALRVIVSWS